MKMAKRFLRNTWRLMRAMMFVTVAVIGAWGVLCAVGCASHKEIHEHQQHTVNVDSMATEAKHEAHKQETTQDIDSIVTASVWAAMQEYASQEHQKETTTETITTWVDSLGREMRQEQRTTQRELSRQEQQRQQQQLQQMTNEIKSHIQTLDSTYNERLSQVEKHLKDSLAKTLDQVKDTNAAPALTWWQKTWNWLKGIIAGLAIAAAVLLVRKYKGRIRIGL
jgi:uncharacterized protein YcfL